MKPTSRRWVEAGKILARDPTAKVRCPVCENEFLMVEDVVHPNDPTRFDRYLRCPKCGAEEVIVRMQKR